MGIAEERIEILFEQAEAKFDADEELSDRYVEIARKIGERTENPIPSELKKKFCRGCGSFFKPGRNCEVEFSKDSSVKYTCKDCGEVKKLEY